MRATAGSGTVFRSRVDPLCYDNGNALEPGYFVEREYAWSSVEVTEGTKHSAVRKSYGNAYVRHYGIARRVQRESGIVLCVSSGERLPSGCDYSAIGMLERIGVATECERRILAIEEMFIPEKWRVDAVDAGESETCARVEESECVVDAEGLEGGAKLVMDAGRVVGICRCVFGIDSHEVMERAGTAPVGVCRPGYQ